MQQVITAKLKLLPTSEQFQVLRQTQLAYRDALNALSQYAFAHKKTSSVTTLHRGMYRTLRTQYRLPSQMACSAEKQVSFTYKGLWTKLKKNAEHRRAKVTKKRFKGLDQPPRFSSPTVTYVYGHDYTMKRNQQVSILTLAGRVVIPYQGYNEHLALIQQGASIGEAKLWYDKPKKCFYLLVTLEVEVKDPSPDIQTSIVGVDVGIRYLAVTATPTKKSIFYSGKQVRHRANHYARLRKRLQQKGTRGAKRRLVRIAQRERRFKLQANHLIAKQIVKEHPHALIGLENLTDIRERTRRRKRRRKKNGKGTEPVSKKQRRANRVYSQWSFAELHTLISYKAALSGSVAIKLDADYTSQACPCCGYTCEENRPGKGLLFVCQNKECGIILHADLVAARNILMRTLLLRSDWSKTGCLSITPDGTDREAKAARLARYAELRWSSVLSSGVSRGIDGARKGAVKTMRDVTTQKRDAILEAARTLFAGKGYEETTIADIAREAGIAVGTVYLYFHNKHEIYTVISLDIEAKLADIFEDPAFLTLPVDQVIRAMVEAAFRACREYNAYMKLFQPDIYTADEMQQYIQSKKRLNQAIERILQSAIERGQWAPFNTAMYAQMLALFGDAVLQQCFAFEAAEREALYREYMIDFIERAFFGPPLTHGNTIV